MASDNLIVCDDEYLTAAYKVESLGDFLTEASTYYSKIIQYILDEAIEDDVMSAGFSRILSQIEPTADAMSAIKTAISEDLKNYITDIDEADSFLYDQI